MSLKSHYSVYELAELHLSSLPKAPKNISDKAKREKWSSRKRSGRGGGIEYAFDSLPAVVQSEIHTRFAVAVVNKPRSEIASVRANLDVQGLCNKQREIADARMELVAYVAELEKVKTRFSAV